MRVDKSGECWLWLGHRNDNGYGVFSVGQKLVLAHRHVWEQTNGVKLEDGQKVLHTCDNPPCVKPDHLFRGTQKDNVTDMMTKGRGRKASGEQHGKSKLSNAQAANIREASGKSLSVLGREFGVSRSTVSRIRSGLSYREFIETGKVLE
jgi:hypothetical protein